MNEKENESMGIVQNTHMILWCNKTAYSTTYNYLEFISPNLCFNKPAVQCWGSLSLKEIVTKLNRPYSANFYQINKIGCCVQKLLDIITLNTT